MDLVFHKTNLFSTTASPRSVSTALKTSNGVKHVELMGDEGERPDPLTEEMFAWR